jgi:hypothetical protein
MKRFTILLITILLMTSCRHTNESDAIKIAFLHHSTGQNIWNGDRTSLASRIVRKIYYKLGWKYNIRGKLPSLFDKNNKQHQKDYRIEEFIFPKTTPYGWKNYPFDYYNIWVKHAGPQPFMEEPTLEMLTKNYSMIIFKHCFPVSNIQTDMDSADIDSDYKSLANYKLQYQALREKLHQFPDTKFVVWTGAAQVKSQITEEEAIRAHDFFSWVVKDWDVPEDNIFIWDFYQLQTEGGLYFLDKFAQSENDSHPNKSFSSFASELLFKRLIDVIENNGMNTEITGKSIN